MTGRAQAVDILRCLAIVGMVLSGQIFWNPELPAWLFHAQMPPPTFGFDPSVAGITWVDLVFPFFLFSMGAAFPLALRRRMEKRVSTGRIVADTVKRWLLLSLFAIALANTRGGTVGVFARGAARDMLLLGTWGLFFMMFARLPELSTRWNRIMNIAGIAGVIGLMAVYSLIPGVEISVHKSDIIILLLALMVLFGTLIWYATRDNLLLRLGILTLLIALRVGSTVPGSWNEALWNWSPAGWLFRFDYLKYLCIVIPGTIAGDLIRRWMRSGQEETNDRPASRILAAGLTTLLFIVVVWSLFTRHLIAGVAISAIVGGMALRLYKKDGSATGKLHYGIFSWGLFWLLLGLAIESLEGGIKKDHATYSYFFTTAALASFAVAVISALLNFWRVKMGFPARCGQNPMIAYTASGFLILPTLALVHADSLLVSLTEAGPWWGVVRGVVVTALMILVTVWLTTKKIFWKT